MAAASPSVVATLEREDDLEGWKAKARALIAQRVPPEAVVWRTQGEGDLFGGSTDQFPPPAAEIKLPRKAVQLAGTAIYHASRERFDLLYRFLWRSQSEPGLAEKMSDPDTAAVHRLAKAIRRDAHKMHAFVRFRKVGEIGGREQFGAWFEPDHHIVEREAPFFVRRFSNMDWVIVTPRKTAIYQNGKLFFRDGGRREDVPGDDSFEDAWKAYYASIFNPARIMTDAMRAEMPKKYWKNMPEASLIPELLESAPRRVAEMNTRAMTDPKQAISAKMIRESAQYGSLEELNATLLAFAEEHDLGNGVRLVAGEGSADADLFFIGEQPGDQEDLAGRPFVGPAGQLFGQYLQSADIDRSSAYVTNAVKRFNFQERGKRRIHQTPKAGEIDLWAPFLMQEHQLVKPKVSVTLGATALRGFFGRPVKLSEVRGETIPLPDDVGGVCVPTFHPSYLLRIQDEGQRQVEGRKFKADLEKARALALDGA
ncbi:UdgX family uracil-DNA binding protein [Parvularcula sp. ZS-1/3]|uniref:Type-4 uracil-DNA glycosylase n=1 Tax=Parvularcula mediterranea TaxID=2732508 RepID=A0A7Y3RJD8_9PROT|nr:UdgX family uracil-DNA binding protein [Parvularcula mediterranea]